MCTVVLCTKLIVLTEIDSLPAVVLKMLFSFYARVVFLIFFWNVDMNKTNNIWSTYCWHIHCNMRYHLHVLILSFVFVLELSCAFCVDLNIKATSFCMNCDHPKPMCTLCASKHIFGRNTEKHFILSDINIFQSWWVQTRRHVKKMQNMNTTIPCLSVLWWTAYLLKRQKDVIKCIMMYLF